MQFAKGVLGKLGNYSRALCYTKPFFQHAAPLAKSTWMVSMVIYLKKLVDIKLLLIKLISKFTYFYQGHLIKQHWRILICMSHLLNQFWGISEKEVLKRNLVISFKSFKSNLIHSVFFCIRKVSLHNPTIQSRIQELHRCKGINLIFVSICASVLIRFLLGLCSFMLCDMRLMHFITCTVQ